ncbi:hypothetical protein HUG10_21585 (plasmid) [Halorarum halophilum]|uniref:Cyanophage baseplate Pam3 plug gp18 domain-containing protein n=1 Tax=Halorarum halophilum TaxID=2743090 RepID=A0A7D5L343_9EURY|nr:hypothetical protein [Halobaculum halophilum]QLG30183.1 hypothetical protein HUG10_21585 [Halobaculum halophilum]
MAIEIVPIDEEHASTKQPIHLEVSGLDAWPTHRFRVTLDWNPVMERWIIEITHLNTDAVVHTGAATLYQPMSVDGYVDFMFLDPSNQAEKITPQNIGNNVVLGVFRGEEVDA